MPDKKNNLFIYEAIELRQEYDKHIKVLENLIEEKRGKRDFLSREEDELQPVKDFDVKLIQEKLQKLKTTLNYDGNEITLSEALEIRKNLIKDITILSDKLNESAYVKIIHKEGRDIIKEPKQKFNDVYQNYENFLKKIRKLNQEIHRINHTEAVNFKDEPL